MAIANESLAIRARAESSVLLRQRHDYGMTGFNSQDNVMEQPRQGRRQLFPIGGLINYSWKVGWATQLLLVQ